MTSLISYKLNREDNWTCTFLKALLSSCKFEMPWDSQHHFPFNILTCPEQVVWSNNILSKFVCCSFEIGFERKDLFVRI
jgi:hypothetical protein